MAWESPSASFLSTLLELGTFAYFSFCHLLTSTYRIRPNSTIPICLDLGTNTQRYLDDPFYMGIRQKRVGDAEMEAFMDEFMEEMSRAFPKLMIQFEVGNYFEIRFHKKKLNTISRISLPTTHSSILRDSATSTLSSTMISKGPAPLSSVVS
jgi:hypothetical protein